MKIKLFFLIVILFTINGFSQTSTCGSVLNDTFDQNGALPQEWTEYNTSGRITVDGGRMKFDHNTSRPSASRTFNPTSSNSTFSFDVSSSRNSVNCQINLVSSSGKKLSTIAVGIQTASIKYATSISNGVPGGFVDGSPVVALRTNTDYTITTQIDFTSKTVDFYGNGQLMAENIPFLEDAENIAEIDIQLIFMWSNTGQFYFDNFSLLSGDDNRLLLISNLAFAESLLTSAVIGNNYNQYSQSAVDSFQSVVDNIKTVLANCDSSSSLLETSVSDLQTAQDSFAAARETGLVLELKNDTGIITENNSGSVIRWENQIEGYGDATQSNSAFGGDILFETYPGKVNVGFSKDGSFLELEGTSALVADNAYSIFYVGKGDSKDRPAVLVGDFDVDSRWGNSSGSRLVKTSDGDISMQYGSPSLQTEMFNTIPKEGFFFIGFTMDSSGNYKYFDNTSPFIKTGTLNQTIKINENNFKLNLYEDLNGPETYTHTEIVEFSMYEGMLNDNDFQTEFERLTTTYADLIVGEFSITNVLPAKRTGLPATSDIIIEFDQNVDENSEYPKIYVNKSDVEAIGTWSLSPANTLTFSPAENWPANSLVSLKITEELKSTDDVSIGLAKGDTYNFIVAPDKTFAYEIFELEEPIATVDFPIAGHKLPLKITSPIIDENTKEKFPVHIWVHGGGWSGGNQETSFASNSPHGEYLAENLGIATLGIAYRCSGSNGTFSLALEDVETAYQWALDNAEQYNLDMTKVFFSGGSAGTPLAALVSQRHSGVIGFIGFNGIYDFVNDAGDFGVSNWYKQNIPSEQANSAIFQLSDTPPATILMHGDKDTTISHTQSILFTDAINAAGGDGETVIYPGEVHAFFNLNKPAYEDVLIEMVNFINKQLKKADLLNVNDVKIIKNQLTVYPNPVKQGDILTIQSNLNDHKTHLEIRNYLGQTVYSKQLSLNSNAIQINTKNLAPGNYVIKVLSDRVFETQKIIIQ